MKLEHRFFKAAIGDNVGSRLEDHIEAMAIYLLCLIKKQQPPFVIFYIRSSYLVMIANIFNFVI